MQTCLTAEGSDWAAVLSENNCLHDHPLIVTQNLSASLLQSHATLVETIACVFSDAYQSLVGHFTVTSIALTPSESCQDSQIVTSDEKLLVAAADVERKFLRLFKVESSPIELRSLTFKRAVLSVDMRHGMYT